MKKIYHLSTCNTCQKIINKLSPLKSFVLQDIKTEAVTPEQLDEMRSLAGSFEALFSKRARLFREKGLHEKSLTEEDYKTLILTHYTFLKRPVILFNNQIFIGNSAKVIAAAKEKIHS